MSYVPPHLRKAPTKEETKEKEETMMKNLNTQDFPALGGGGKASTATKWSSNNVVAWSEDADQKRREEEYIRSIREEKQRKKEEEDRWIRSQIPSFNRKPAFASTPAPSTTKALTQQVTDDDGWTEVKAPVRKEKTFVDHPPEEEYYEQDNEDYDAEDY